MTSGHAVQHGQPRTNRHLQASRDTRGVRRGERRSTGKDCRHWQTGISQALADWTTLGAGWGTLQQRLTCTRSANGVDHARTHETGRRPARTQARIALCLRLRCTPRTRTHPSYQPRDEMTGGARGAAGSPILSARVRGKQGTAEQAHCGPRVVTFTKHGLLLSRCCGHQKNVGICVRSGIGASIFWASSKAIRCASSFATLTGRR